MDSGEAAAWQGAVRTTDLLARYGGEEFGLLPACSVEDAIDAIKEVRLTRPGTFRRAMASKPV